MEYKKLVELYESLNSTTGRLKKAEFIYNHIKNTDNSEDIIDSILLIQGRIFPNWNRKEIGISTKLVIKAISSATGASIKEIEDTWKKTGDLGDTVVKLISKKQQMALFKQDLTIREVLTDLRKVAEIEGKGTTDIKTKMISKLLNQAEPEESRYIIRTVLEDMRTGASEGVLRDAIIWTMPEIKNISVKENGKGYDFEMHPGFNFSDLQTTVEDAINLTNDIPRIALIAKNEGLKGLYKIKLDLGKPINLMLYPKASDVKEAFKSLLKEGETELAFEYKYDGFRVQIHKDNNKIKLFTRRLDEVTTQFPDVIKAVKTHIKANRAILDAEIIGYDKESGKYLPFQSISQRIRRKYDIEEIAEKFPVELNIFDIIYFEEESLIKAEFKDRRAYLEKIVEEKDKIIKVSKKITTSSEEETNEFYKEALSLGFEGIMAKSLSAPYKPGRRMGYGMKLKPVMEELDLVITAAEWGTGKRANWLTSFTVGFFDEENELVEIGKVGSGLKELESEGLSYSQMTELLRPLIIEDLGKEVKVKPEIIIEVHYEEIQTSPSYSSGFALRFPRIIRLRDDKGLDEIADINQVEMLFKKQKREI